MLFILAAGIGICWFMLIQLWQKKDHMGQARYWAMAIQLLWIIRFAFFYAKLMDVNSVPAWLVIYDQSLLFLDGPLIWLYTRSLTEKQKFSGRVWLHFIPFAVVFGYDTYQLINFPAQIRQLFQDTWRAFENGETTLQGVGFVVVAGIIFFNLVYLLQSVKVARAYNKAIEEEYSTTERMTANWIIQFQRLWLVLFVVPLVLYFGNYTWPILPMITLGAIGLAAIVLLSVIFNINLIKQVYVALPQLKSSRSTVHPAIPANEQKVKVEELLAVLAKDKAYLEESLTLSDLAKSLAMKPNELTTLIKYSDYENFYDLINSFRLEEVKTELVNSDEQVIQIAYQCGFRSKSTFNKIFKEKTGLTPKEYRNSHQ